MCAQLVPLAPLIAMPCIEQVRQPTSLFSSMRCTIHIEHLDGTRCAGNAHCQVFEHTHCHTQAQSGQTQSHASASKGTADSESFNQPTPAIGMLHLLASLPESPSLKRIVKVPRVGGVEEVAQCLLLGCLTSCSAAAARRASRAGRSCSYRSKKACRRS